jgi:hypothetical protein
LFLVNNTAPWGNIYINWRRNVEKYRLTAGGKVVVIYINSLHHHLVRKDIYGNEHKRLSNITLWKQTLSNGTALLLVFYMSQAQNDLQE